MNNGVCIREIDGDFIFCNEIIHHGVIHCTDLEALKFDVYISAQILKWSNCEFSHEERSILLLCKRYNGPPTPYETIEWYKNLARKSSTMHSFHLAYLIGTINGQVLFIDRTFDCRSFICALVFESGIWNNNKVALLRYVLSRFQIIEKNFSL